MWKRDKKKNGNYFEYAIEVLKIVQEIKIKDEKIKLEFFILIQENSILLKCLIYPSVLRSNTFFSYEDFLDGIIIDELRDCCSQELEMSFQEQEDFLSLFDEVLEKEIKIFFKEIKKFF